MAIKDFANMMKQAQDLQSKMSDMQNALADTMVEGQAGAGLVTVSLNGKGQMMSIKIDPSLMKPDEAEVLEDLIVAAHTDAKSKAEVALQEQMQELTGGLPLPPGMKLF